MRGSRGAAGLASLVAAGVLAALVITSDAVAQDAQGTPPVSPVATPAASPAASPAPAAVVTTDPASCTVAPRPADFLVALVDSPPPATTSIPGEGIPDGTPADAAVRAEVTAAVTELIACVNAGDLLRAFALYDDAYLARLLDPEGQMTAEIAAELAVSFAAAEVVPEGDRTTLVGLPLVRQLPDGRVAVVTETNGGLADEDDDTELGLLVLARTADGRWLVVDGRTDLSRDDLPAT